MIELKGKYNTAKIFTDVVDTESISQVLGILNLESLKDTKIRLMPDIHAGKGCTIGTTILLKDKVIPSLTGVDIGCGMLLVRIAEKDIDFQRLDTIIQENVPSGCNIHTVAPSSANAFDFSRFICPVNVENAKRSIGTLGGGNHFIEVDRDDEGNNYLIVHSGSRHLGLEICNHYQNFAYHNCNHSSKEEVQELIRTLKSQGRHREIEKEIHKLKDVKRTDIPKDLCHLEGPSFQDYIHDMKTAQEYASTNRKEIADRIVKEMEWTVKESFSTIHNYIDTENMILRKGSVSARQGEKLLIPINMRDGALICIGKGNPDWNYSAPHGAGRLMSRSKAKEMIDLKEFKDSMEGIYSTSVCDATLDESPFAYKNLNDILDNITDTAEVIKQIKPVYNFKAH